MSKIEETEYWVPEHVRAYLRELGFVLPLEAMEGHIKSWHEWMSAVGEFYDYKDSDGFGRIYEVHHMSIHPAMRVCQEWGSLLGLRPKFWLMSRWWRQWPVGQQKNRDETDWTRAVALV